MNHAHRSTKGLTRRGWMVLVASMLSACGGGGGTTASYPGTGGTGIYALGSISGFGSVIVNGTRFDDAVARVQIDGLDATSAQLRLGMVAQVQGERGADPTLVTASDIAVWKIAQGTLTQPGAGGFLVAGMTIQTSANTVFDGVSGVGALVSGQSVAVWGLQAAADGSRWSATRVEVVTINVPTVSSGRVSVSNGQRSLNGLLLTGNQVSALVAGALVRVQGDLSARGDSLALATVTNLSSIANSQVLGDVEIEGYVTAVGAAGRFTLGSIEVDSASAQVLPLGAALAVGTRVDVHGTWNAGVLKADKVELEDEHERQHTEIKGVISSFTSVASFVVRGQRCDASAAVFSHGQASDLRVGVEVKVEGESAGDVLLVRKLEFED